VNSENVFSAIKQAKFKGLKTILLSGETAGKMNNISDVTIKIPSNDTQRIQEAHIMVGQILCGLLEEELLK
jgi:D-sedoheptulose 7-phosphate isomerase